VAAAPPGGRVWLHGPGGPFDPLFIDGVTVVDRPLTIEAPPGQAPEAVVVRSAGAALAVHEGVVVATADAVTLRGFTIEVSLGGRAAFSAAHPTDATLTSGHTLDRMRLLSTSVAYHGANTTQAAVNAGPATMVMNTYAAGWFEGLVDVGPSLDAAGANGDAVGVVVAHNTAILVEARPLVRANTGTGAGLTVLNNVLVTLNPSTGAVIEVEIAGAQIAGNEIKGPARITPNTDGPGANTLGSTRLYDMSSPKMTAQSNGGVALVDVDVGPLDYAGASRADTNVPGALATASESAPLSTLLQIAPATSGCGDGNACDFTGEDALARAIAVAHPNSTIRLHASPGGETFVADDVVVDRPLVIERATSSPAGSIFITHAAPTVRAILNVVEADGVVFRGLAFALGEIGRRAIWFDPGPISATTGVGNGAAAIAARDGRVERAIVVSFAENGVDVGFAMGHGGVLRSSVVMGPIEALAEVHVSDVRIELSQLNSTEGSGDTAALFVGGSTGLVIDSSLFDLRGVIAPVRAPFWLADINNAALAVPDDIAVVHSLFFGLNDEGQVPLDSVQSDLFSCYDGIQIVPGACFGVPEYTDEQSGDLSPTAQSVVIERGSENLVGDVAELDVRDASRVAGNTCDVGAFEFQF